MLRHPTRARVFAGAALVLALACGAAACSSSSAPPPVSNPGTAIPVNTGDRCSDAAGDVAASSDGTVRSTAPGADILEASAVLDDRALQVRFKVAGPIDDLVDPLFLVAQGQAGQPNAYEVRASEGPSGDLVVSITTFKGGDRRTPPLADVTVKVQGDELTYAVPRKDLPVAGSSIWQFGSAATAAPDEVFDECNPLGGSTPPITKAPGTSNPGTTALQASPPPQPIGTPLLAGQGGDRVTVFEVREPSAAKPLPVPPDAGNKVVAADVEVCAGTDPLATSSSAFALQTADNRQYKPWTANATVVDPALPDAQAVSPGECLRGWVAYQVPQAAVPARVAYDTGGDGKGPFLSWTVA